MSTELLDIALDAARAAAQLVRERRGGRGRGRRHQDFGHGRRYRGRPCQRAAYPRVDPRPPARRRIPGGGGRRHRRLVGRPLDRGSDRRHRELPLRAAAVRRLGRRRSRRRSGGGSGDQRRPRAPSTSPPAATVRPGTASRFGSGTPYRWPNGCWAQDSPTSSTPESARPRPDQAAAAGPRYPPDRIQRPRRVPRRRGQFRRLPGGGRPPLGLRRIRTDRIGGRGKASAHTRVAGAGLRSCAGPPTGSRNLSVWWTKSASSGNSWTPLTVGCDTSCGMRVHNRR